MPTKTSAELTLFDRLSRLTFASAAFALVLEEKLILGLAAPPPERESIESLSEEELIALALVNPDLG